ncbi:MAG: molecular chaperone DnaJ [Alphaproteobacteria bacterium]
MAKRDYYDVLGVDRQVSADDMKKAYRKLAMKLHPDRNPGDAMAEQSFKELNEAYAALKDEDQRAAYDRFGHAAFEQGGGRPGGAGGFDFAGGFADIFDEMFGEFMGGRGGGQSATRGADLRYNLEIALVEAYAGKQATIDVPSTVACSGCQGSGAASGTRPISCPSCQGAGKVRSQQGFFTIERTCPACHGAGRVIERPCGTCGGAGREHQEKTLNVNIPAGVEDGTRIRLSGEGEAGLRGGPAGDLYIFLTCKPHSVFRRDGANLQLRVPLSMTTAALGGTIEVPTIDGGRARVSVPAGTQSGHQFRLKGKGMSVLRSASHGDMYIQIQIETPVNLSKRQQELLREFDKAGGKKSHSPEAESFFGRVKELWHDLKD